MNRNGIELPEKNIYFKDESTVIYCADCKDILPYFEDKSFDLVLTDPPYGMNYHSGRYKGINPHAPIVGDEHYPIEILDDFQRITKGAILLFCRWDNLYEVPKPKSFISMIKNNWSAGDLEGAFGRQWEGILFYPQDEFKFNHRLPDVLDCRRIPPTKLLHPTQKSEYPIQTLIEECSPINAIILDPFLGSGTTTYCANKLNRKGIGIEISEKYCKIAVERLRQSVMKLDIS